MAQLRVTASLLNVRSGPGAEYPVLTRILEGAIVDQAQTSSDGRWVEVRAHLADGSVIGWVSSAYVSGVSDTADDAAEIPWLRVAEREIGIAEFPGPDDNPRILQYHATTTYGARDDEIPWCSSFMNWCMREAGIAGTDSASALSWLDWGQPLDAPIRGCVVVFTRGASPTQGHVALFIQPRGALHSVLGGNQSNQVRIAAYPTRSVLGYRWPR